MADVAGEVDPATGRFVYGTAVVSVPRRAGNTILTLATSLQRVQQIDMGRAGYTAQTGSDAGTTFRDSWAPIVARSVVASAYRLRLSNGSQAITTATRAGCCRSSARPSPPFTARTSTS